MLLTAIAGLTGVSPALYQDLHWRFVGPLRGGRTTSIAGVPGRPNLFYIGVVNGGIWKTDDAGRTWTPIFDSQPTGSIGALAIAPSNANVIYAGSGEGLQRPDLAVGDGIYKSNDAGSDLDAPRFTRRAADCGDRRRSEERRSRFRGGARSSVRSQRRARHLSLDRRRCFVFPSAVQERKYRRVRRRARSARSEHGVCDVMGGASSPVGNRRIVRDTRQRDLQVHRRRNDLDATHRRPSRANWSFGNRSRAEATRRSCTHTPIRKTTAAPSTAASMPAPTSRKPTAIRKSRSAATTWFRSR